MAVELLIVLAERDRVSRGAAQKIAPKNNGQGGKGRKADGA